MRKSAPLFCALLLSLSARRAWIEILYYGDDLTFADGSLSARRAWIEITKWFNNYGRIHVALRKESVDRNISEDVSYNIIIKSLSARRAWIEIFS